MKKYKTYKIEETPTDKYPQMVTLSKGKKISKKFINEEKAIIWVEKQAAESLINRGNKKVKYELESIGFYDDDNLSFTW